MPVKHQIDSFRKGGEFVCWCDGYNNETTVAIVDAMRSAGVKVKRQKDRIFVRLVDVDGRPQLAHLTEKITQRKLG